MREINSERELIERDGEMERAREGRLRRELIDEIPVLEPITVRPVRPTAPEFQPKPGETECVECGERYTGRMHICPAKD